MIRNLFLLSMILGLLGFALYFSFAEKTTFAKKLIRVGYCPTMTPYVEQLKDEKNFQLRPYQSSQEALFALAKQEVDCLVIGRKARDQEITTV